MSLFGVSSGVYPGELLDECGSTNDLAKQRGLLGSALAPHGTWVSARVQTAGRGRMGRQWVSEPGNLFLSVILRPNTHRYWTWIPLLGAVCVLDLVSRDEAYRRQSGSHVRRFSIKWPNDLWIDGAKWGGILCEAVHAQSASPFIVLGLGLNAGLAPKGLDQETASIDDPEFSDRLRQPLVAAIAEGVSRLDREGPGWVRAAYESWAEFRRGDLVQWKSEGKVLEAKVAELGEMGELRVEFQDGSLRSLYAEEVSAVRARA